METRKNILSSIEENRNSNVIFYATSDRPGMEAQIDNDAFDHFVHHLDAIWSNKRNKITLILHTAGGNTSAAWRIINLLRIFCDELEIIIPNRAHSAGTLISLGCDKILMTKQATLGPIDPSLSGPLSPQVPNSPNQRVPVSVEAVQGFIDLAKKEMGIEDSGALAQILNNLSGQVHPLVLGQIFRSRTQIRSLANDLLSHNGVTNENKKKIVDFLCSESGSHDRTINRREAKSLGLNVEKTSQDLYEMVNNLYENLASSMLLRTRFDQALLLAGNPQGNVDCERAVIESVTVGSTALITRGTVKLLQTQQQLPNGQMVPLTGTEMQINFEGWEDREWDA